MKENQTLDSFMAVGKLADEFIAAYNDIENSTLHKKMSGEDVVMLYAAPAPLQKIDGSTTFYVMSKTTLIKERMTGSRMMIPVDNDVFGPEILEDLMNGTKTAVEIDGEIYALSPKTTRALATRGGLTGDAFKRWNEQTAMHVADAVTAADNEINFVVRRADNGAGRVVATLSDSFSGDHDSVLDAMKTISDEFGLPKMLLWQITNDFVKAAVELPIDTGIEDVGRGVMLMASDVGYAASAAYTVVRFRRSDEFILAEKYSTEHRGKSDTDKDPLANNARTAATAESRVLDAIASCTMAKAPTDEAVLKSLYMSTLVSVMKGDVCNLEKRDYIAKNAVERCPDPDTLFDCAEALIQETLRMMEPGSETKFRARKALSGVPEALLNTKL